MTEIRPISFASQQLQQIERPVRNQTAPLVRFGGDDCGDTCDVGHKHDDHDKHDHGKKEPGLVQKWKNKTSNFFSTWSLIQNPITWTLAGIVAGIALGGVPIVATVPIALLLGIALASSEGKGLTAEEDQHAPEAGKDEGAEKGKGDTQTVGPEGGEDAKVPVNGSGDDAPEVTETAPEAPQVDVIPTLPKIEITQAQADAIGRHLNDDAFAQAVNAAFDAGALKLDGNKVVLTDTAYAPETTSKTVQRAFTLLKGLVAQAPEKQQEALADAKTEFADEQTARQELAAYAAAFKKLSAEGQLVALAEKLNAES